MFALMFSLVFVSVKLNGEHGNHLSPSLGEKPSWLMVFPRNHKITTGWLSGFQIHLPGTPNSSPPKQRRVRGISSWTHSLFYLAVERDGDDQALGPSPGAFSHTWFVAFLTPIGETKQPLPLSRSLIGLIQTKPRQAFAFLSFITFILIWTRSLDFKVAWLFCCQFNVSLHSNSQPVNVTHILLD